MARMAELTGGEARLSRRAATTRSSASTPPMSASTPACEQRRLPLTQRAQVALHLVREHLRLAQLHHAGDALERMEAANSSSRIFGSDRRAADRAVERQQQRPHRS